jgi:hypothetical protein
LSTSQKALGTLPEDDDDDDDDDDDNNNNNNNINMYLLQMGCQWQCNAETCRSYYT